YVLGREDGTPKTPAWASPKCGIPEWTIKALARQFAAKVTSILHYFGGGLIRGAWSHEPGRLEVVMLGMQGLGKPGVHQARVAYHGLPRDDAPKGVREAVEAGFFFPCEENDRIRRTHAASHRTYSRQVIMKTLIQDAILNPPVSFYGRGEIGAPVEDQFKRYTYPIPKEEGGTEIHMIWTDTPCRTTCWNDGMRTIEAMRSPKIECVVAQHPWLENDCLLADIILPSNTTFEVDDIVSNTLRGNETPSMTFQKKAIEPIGESMSDYEVVLEIAKKMGVYDQVTQGKSVPEWIKEVFDKSGLGKLVSWEDFQEKGYYVFSPAEGWENDPAGLYEFYKDPEGHALKTPSGKLEFYSERLARYFPDDNERPPSPQWIEKGITLDERLTSYRARKYPLLMMSNHGRWREHSQADDISWTREALTCKIMGLDGYMYEPCWIHPTTAAGRGIRNGDIVNAYNERGGVLGGAYVTERIMPGVVYMDHGARCDWIVPGELDRGGAINLISPGGTTSKNAGGQATSGYLVEVKKVPAAQMEEWKEKYPEAFERDYDPATGPLFNGWVEGGM
ncbi:molybdopterin dinucleotide binding domain-containing protein, partial [Chloroflexota bacterium]